MAEAKCLNCGKSVKLADKFVGKRIRCPSCGTPVLVGGQGDIRLDKNALRQELARLAGTQGAAASAAQPEQPAASGADAARQQAAPAKERAGTRQPRPEKKAAAAPADGGGPEIQEARKSYRGTILAIVLVIGVGALGAGAAFMYRLHEKNAGQKQSGSRADVIATIEAANRANTPCQEREALARYQEALGKAREYERTYADGSFVEKITTMQQQISNLKQLVTSREKLISQLDEYLYEAKKQIRDAKYADAKRTLETAKGKSAAFQSDCEKKQVAKLTGEIKQLLDSKPVSLGSKGYTLFEGDWRSPADMKKLMAERKLAELRKQEEEFVKKGLVKYNGKWMKPEERELLVAKAGKEAEAKAKETAEAQKELLEKQKQKIAAALQRAKLKDLIRSKDPVVMLDDGSAGVLWHNEDWANPIKYEVIKSNYYGHKNGENLLKCTLENGEKDKWVVSYDLSADVTGRDYIVADFVVTSDTIEVALGAWTMPSWTLFESPPLKLRKGVIRDISWPLKEKRFKCRASNWAYNSDITNGDALYKMSFFIYARAGTEFLVTNVRLIKGNQPTPKLAPLPQ